MGYLDGLIEFARDVAIAVVSRQAVEEIKVWTPHLWQALLKVALTLCPDRRRERLDEEWRSHIEATPGEIGKIILVGGLVSAALKIAVAEQLLSWRHTLLYRVAGYSFVICSVPVLLAMFGVEVYRQCFDPKYGDVSKSLRESLFSLNWQIIRGEDVMTPSSLRTFYLRFLGGKGILAHLKVSLLIIGHRRSLARRKPSKFTGF